MSRWVNQQGIRRAASLMLTLALLALAGCGGGSGNNGAKESGADRTTPQSTVQTPTPGAQPKTGGVLKVALNSAPPTLDYHQTTAGLTKKVAWHIYETLYALGKDYRPVPMLAEGHEVSEDGTVYTIRLRRGVKFHNGKEMTARDVIASLQRWSELSGVGKALFANVSSLTAKDDYTVVLTLKKPSATVLSNLATPDQAPAIMPAEIVEKAGKDPVAEYVGTGPFRFVEWQKDQYIKLARFDEYQPRSEEPAVLAGRKVAYVDELIFYFVRDANVRVDGVVTGEYDVADIVPADHYERLKDLPDIQLAVEKPFRFIGTIFNTSKPPFNNVALRQAVLAAIDNEEVMAAAVGPEPFWRLDGSLMFQETAWHSTAGTELYNQKNPEKARELAQAAGYKGETITFVTTKDYPYMYNTALVVSEQLKRAGFNVDLQVYDWPTALEIRGQKEKWDLFVTGFLFTAEPSEIVFLNALGTWPGWWVDKTTQELLEQLNTELDFAKRKAIFDQIQTRYYQEIPVIKHGDAFELVALRKNVQGFVPLFDITFWNVWKE